MNDSSLDKTPPSAPRRTELEKLTLRELSIPIIKAIDSFNFLLKSHHRRTAIICCYIGQKMGLDGEDVFQLVIAAALHDIGALSVQERDMLIKEDVLNPKPHCIIGYRMLSTFDVFKDIAQIIKHHHVKYPDSLEAAHGDIPLASHIIHLADRVEVFVNPNEFVLNQKDVVVKKIRRKVGTVFHPEVFKAFEEVARSDIFWIETSNLTMEQLFRKIDTRIDYNLTIDNIVDFSLTLSRIIDFRSRFTAAHSFTVAQLAHFIGSCFGYSEERCKKLLVSGYLHDIGKIGIDPGLIEKEGALSVEEFNMIKLHTYYTGQILKELSTSGGFSEIVYWAETHHEKADGSGYPYALNGEQLDEGGMILSFSDVISALMEERPYRKKLDIDVAFEIIRTQIAPKISSEMFATIERHKDEIEALVLQCQDQSFEAYDMVRTVTR